MLMEGYPDIEAYSEQNEKKDLVDCFAQCLKKRFRDLVRIYLYACMYVCMHIAMLAKTIHQA